jgi:hypothetical protein
MLDLSDSFVLLIIAGLVLLNTLVLGGFLALFRPGEYGYFAGQGRLLGWATCLGVSLYFSILAIIPAPLLVLWLMWWVVSVYLFRLTIRQTLKFIIAQNVFYFILVFGVAAIVG